MNRSAVLATRRTTINTKELTVSVIVVTLQRPEYVQRCLTCLHKQTRLAEQIIVVDASSDDLTKQVVEKFPTVLYLRNENGVGRMTQSRNIGLASSTGNIVAFLDDDSFAHEDWLENLIASYEEPSVGAAGGRALNNLPNEETNGINQVGRITADGEISGYFAADPGRSIEVDHIMGCNMSFRREVIQQLGGFREDYPGISGLCEDTDMSIRVTNLGWKILFNPAAQVVHLGAPQVLGRRFDVRWTYFNTRNTMCLLLRNYGYMDTRFIRFPVKVLLGVIKKFFGAMVRLLAVLVGLISGFIAGTALIITVGRDPVRRDREGARLSEILRYADQNDA